MLTLVEALEQIGFKVIFSTNSVKIGKNEYIVKSVFTGKNKKSLQQSILELAKKKALKEMRNTNFKY